MKNLNLGLLPAAGGGVASMAKTGQVSRLTDYYFPAYLEGFEHLYYFSYHQETLNEHTDDPAILDRVSLVPKLRRSPYRCYAFQLPFVARTWFQACDILRAFQTTGAVPAILASLTYGIPYVTTYGYRYHAFAAVEKRWISSIYLRLLEPLALRLAAGVIVTTEELVGYVSRFVPDERIHLIPNGVDTVLFAPTERSGEKGDVTRILFIGRLTRQKNLDRLIKAVHALNARHTIRLEIIGEGPLRRELEETAVQQQVDCVFLGTVPHGFLPEHMNQADAFVLPSLAEGHPKVLIEAMSCGRPCVASDCEGNRVLIEHEVTGLLFNPKDVDDIASSIERIITHRDLARCLGIAARRHVCANLDLRELLARETTLLAEATCRQREE